MSDIDDSCDDELVVIQDAPEDRTDSEKGEKNYHIMLVNYWNIGNCHQRTARKDVNERVMKNLSVGMICSRR